jgi:hypothetical protein
MATVIVGTFAGLKAAFNGTDEIIEITENIDFEEELAIPPATAFTIRSNAERVIENGGRYFTLTQTLAGKKHFLISAGLTLQNITLTGGGVSRNITDIDDVTGEPVSADDFFTVTYDANGGDGGTANYYAPAGDTVTVPAASLFGFTNGKLGFIGWHTVRQPAEESGGVLYLAGNAFEPASTENIVLYAQWAEPAVENSVTVRLYKTEGHDTLVPLKRGDNTELLYTLTYDFNGGTSALQSLRYYEVGTAAAVADPNSVTRKDYIMAGWQHDIDSKIFGAGSTVEMTRNTVLSALWLPNKLPARLSIEMKILH